VSVGVKVSQCVYVVFTYRILGMQWLAIWFFVDCFIFILYFCLDLVLS